jgi:hypothetical protein
VIVVFPFAFRGFQSFQTFKPFRKEDRNLHHRGGKMTALRSFQSFKMFQPFQTLETSTQEKQRDILLGAPFDFTQDMLCGFARDIPSFDGVPSLCPMRFALRASAER